MTTLSLLRAGSNKSLAKIWTSDGQITPAANATWFQAKEISVTSVEDICCVLDVIEKRPRVALVKEAVARGVDVSRLRRRCSAGIDEHTDEPFPAGLVVVPRTWIVLDIEKLPRPPSISFKDGARLAAYARDRMPDEFKPTACAWQLSGSSGHASRLDEIRLHLFFMLDTAIVPQTWKSHFSGRADMQFIDPSAFDKGKLIFTAAPIIHEGSDPIAVRHGVLQGRPIVAVPKVVTEEDARLAGGAGTVQSPTPVQLSEPMPEAAATFVEIVATSNILRSQHNAYRNDRSRRLAFCALLKGAFGITDEAVLAQAFRDACVGEDDPSGEHDVRQAVRWASTASSSGRGFSVRKLLCDASVGLHAVGDSTTAARAARLAMFFRELETSAALIAEECV
jgi:hypothetical protein